MGFFDILSKVAGAAGDVATGGSGLVGLFDSIFGDDPRAQETEYLNRQATAYNDFLEQYGEAGKMALELFRQNGIDPFGMQTSTSSGTGSSFESYDETMTPTLGEEYQPLNNLELALLQRRLSSPTGLPAGYEETGVNAINQSFEGAANDERNFARNRGLDPSLLAIGSPNERARRGQIASFRAETPLKARELQNQDIGLAENMLKSRMGRRTTGSRRGSSTSSSTSTRPPDYMAALQFLLPPGPKAPYFGDLHPTGMPEYGNEGWNPGA